MRPWSLPKALLIDDKRWPGRGLTLAELDHLREIVHPLAAVLALHERQNTMYEERFTQTELGLARLTSPAVTCPPLG